MKPQNVGRLPDFVVVGAMRSGSSSVFRYLADHPGVFMATPKELHFFDASYDRGLDWYRDCFADAQPQQLAGEATPTYLGDPGALSRLTTDVPNVKMLAVLRDPVDRAYSHYWMRHARGRENRAWDDVVDDELREHDPGGYLAGSAYSGQLRILFDLSPRSHCHVFPFEALRDSPTATFLDICTFLGIERCAPSSVGRQVNAHMHIRSSTLRRLAKARGVPARLRNAVAKFNQTEVEYPAMASDTRRRLESHLSEERRAVPALLGWPTNPWSPPSSMQ